MGSSPTLGAIFLAAGVAELADAQDLKSCDLYRSYRFDPGLRHQIISYRRGVEQLVARRAHNPEVAGSNPVPATIAVKAIDTIVSVALTFFGAQKRLKYCVFH